MSEEYTNPSVVLEVLRFTFPEHTERDLKRAILGSARQGDLWAKCDREEVFFCFPPEMGLDPRELAFGYPAFVGCEAFTSQLACQSEFWTNSRLHSRYTFKPRDLPGKWPRDFSADEQDVIGTVETFCEGVKFNREMLKDVILDPKFMRRSKALEGNYEANAKGRPDSKKWKDALSHLVARAAARDFMIPSDNNLNLLTELFTHELGESFVSVDPRATEPTHQKRKVYGQFIAKNVIDIRNYKRKIKRMTRAPN